jgi:hypothetical protein
MSFRASTLRGMSSSERWRPIPGYERLYEVSDLGRVFGIKRGRLITGTLLGEYRAVHLSKNGVARWELVHRLVLLAFVGPAPEGLEACHADGSRDNNALTNLRWATPKENAADRIRHGRQARRCGTSNPQAKLTDRQVRLIRQSQGRLRITADKFGVSEQTVWSIRNRVGWRHLG